MVVNVEFNLLWLLFRLFHYRKIRSSRCPLELNIFFSNNHSLASLTNKERSVHAPHSEKMIVFSTSTKSFSNLNLAMLTKCTY